MYIEPFPHRGPRDQVHRRPRVDVGLVGAASQDLKVVQGQHPLVVVLVGPGRKLVGREYTLCYEVVIPCALKRS